MTVKELTEYISKYNPDTELCMDLMYLDDYGDFSYMTDVVTEARYSKEDNMIILSNDFI